MSTTQHIQAMSELLDKGEICLPQLQEQLTQFSDLQKNLLQLFAYYNSPEWLKDVENDEKGSIPATINRGVLSEDGVYNLLVQYKEIINDMQSIVQADTL